ncbi:YqgE/AlgH family protein [Lewinella sp. 4G2]|uniref:YqgE/AlgH family protein n=1 Tax=Lewinella sp. 4G2 TaxID=1803372 RepID=UPI0007B48287|nr:YqgE/AlgH family protein [Lewinella sp. 4G2]OAV45245.1 hypothetical protein A3850_012400 [Lewinella sp. 4G2]
MSQQLRTGTILLAEPFMLDGNFKRSTVLLVDHSHDGSVGFILNRKMELSVTELVDDLEDFDAPVYFGGPVGSDTVHYLHCKGDLIEGADEISRGVYWGGDYEKLKTLINNKLITPNDIRFYVGYSGWSENQLEEEMEIGSWVTAQMDANYLFKTSPDELWKKIMSDKGHNFSVIAEIEDSPNYN